MSYEQFALCLDCYVLPGNMGHCVMVTVTVTVTVTVMVNGVEKVVSDFG